MKRRRITSEMKDKPMNELTEEEFDICMRSRDWRLNHLYSIIDKHTNKIQFRFKEEQRQLYDNRWYNNIIVKARQIGFSTMIDIMALDYALFAPNRTVAIIAHTREDAEAIFDKKVRFAYENLPPAILDDRRARRDNARELKFSNGSIIKVDTSARSDVINFLHISEFGKICAQYPQKAKEIITGSLPAVATGNMVFIESTAEGSSGKFYDMAQHAMELKRRNARLTKRDYKLFFFPWWEESEYVIDQHEIQYVTIPESLENYFERLKNDYDITLSDAQKAWYCTEKNKYGDAMKREYPSHFDECFEEAIEGAYYSNQFAKMYEDNRISTVPHDPACLVDTAWDIGVGDSTAIWFTQTIGSELHWIDYYENSGEGVEHYVNILREKQEERGFRYGHHYVPHDAAVREWGAIGAETRLGTLRRLGVRITKQDIVPQMRREDGIEITRQTLNISMFDERHCKQGIDFLKAYHRKWDEKNGRWLDDPAKGAANHCADAARYRSIMYRLGSHMSRNKGRTPRNRNIPVGAWT